MKLKWVDGTIIDLKLAWIPRREGDRTRVGYLSFLPATWRACLAYDRPLNYVIRSIHGLPEGWSISNISPEIGDLVTLDPMSKHHPLYLELVTASDVSEGFRFNTTVEIAMEGFPSDFFHTLRVGASFVRDTIPPQLRVNIDGRELSIEASDPSSGMAWVEVRYSMDAGKSFVTEIVEPTSEHIEENRTLTATYRFSLPDSTDLYQVRGYDDVDNLAETPIQFLESVPKPSMAEPSSTEDPNAFTFERLRKKNGYRRPGKSG
ncbi:MAG: hypothetical protein ACE5GK_11835 [Nitrospiria bacterium]